MDYRDFLKMPKRVYLGEPVRVGQTKQRAGVTYYQVFKDQYPKMPKNEDYFDSHGVGRVVCVGYRAEFNLLS
jgi:hypothetical protein